MTLTIKRAAISLLLTLLSLGGLFACAGRQEALTIRCVNGNMIEIKGAHAETGKADPSNWDFTKECELIQSSGKQDK